MSIPGSPRPAVTIGAVQPKQNSVVVPHHPPLYREGVVRALQSSGQVLVVAEAGNGREAFEAIVEHEPTVALVDFKLPGLDGAAIAHAVTRDGLPTRVLIVSAFGDSGVVYKALESGAAGFLSKETRREQIVDAVLACARGENVIPPEIAAGLVPEIRARRDVSGPILTDREMEILKLISEGMSLPDIAKKLFLGVTTVKTHVQHLYEKLEVSDRAAAVATAMRRGLIE